MLALTMLPAALYAPSLSFRWEEENFHLEQKKSITVVQVLPQSLRALWMFSYLSFHPGFLQ
jgi:hypothetical protein